MNPQAQPTADVELRPGEVFADRYEIVRRLGAGGVAVVYEARDKTDWRRVALKLIRPAAAQNRRVVARYQLDLITARQLSDENLVGILDAAEHGGIVYVVLEHIEGSTLEEWRRRRAGIPATGLLPMFTSLCAGAACLHAKGLVHGEISPWNVMVTQSGRVKLMDFGIVRDPRQEMTGAPNRSLNYRAPEQLIGRSVTTAADVYSLGAVAFEALTGARVHDGLGLAERCTAPAPRLPSTARVMPAFARIIERCLDPEPEQRFPDAAALQAALAGITVQSAQDTQERPASAPLPATPVPVEFAIRFLSTACARLREIHAQGLSHPDLSPQTMLSGRTGQVEIQSRIAPPPGATVLIAQPKYAAPEQLLGGAAPDDPSHIASDIYVLGFIAYELLADRQRFEQQFQGAVRGDLGWMSWHADAGRRLAPLIELAPDCPPAVSSLLEKMTAKDPAKRLSRLEDVESAAAQLSRLWETTADFSIGPEPPAVASPPPRRKRGRLRAAVAAAAALLLGLTAWELWTFHALDRLLPVVARVLHLKTAAAAGQNTALRGGPQTLETATGPMALVPGAEFTMGSDSVRNEAPAHRVTLPPFYLDRFEVTNARFRAFCDREQRSYPPAPAWDTNYLSRDDHPALNIRWREARDFCASAGKRLPTEAEWELAARGSGVSSAQWVNWVAPGFANLKDSGPGAPAAVGTFPSDVSPNGIYDLAGNVHEWVADDYHLYAGNTAPGVETGSKTVRGGSFALHPPDLSPAWRASLAPDLAAGQDLPVGFRCAADIDSAIVRLGTH